MSTSLKVTPDPISSTVGHAIIHDRAFHCYYRAFRENHAACTVDVRFGHLSAIGEE